MQEVHCRISSRACKTQRSDKPHAWHPEAIRALQGLRQGYKQQSGPVPELWGADGEYALLFVRDIVHG